MGNFTSAYLMSAIQKAVDAADAKGVTVTVALEEHGFMGDHTKVTITASPSAKPAMDGAWPVRAASMPTKQPATITAPKDHLYVHWRGLYYYFSPEKP